MIEAPPLGTRVSWVSWDNRQRFGTIYSTAYFTRYHCITVQLDGTVGPDGWYYLDADNLTIEGPPSFMEQVEAAVKRLADAARTADTVNGSGVAQKQDTAKSRMDLIDADFLLVLGDVLRYGAEKYEPNNWRLGIDASRLYAAVQRHLCAFWVGEDADSETGFSHLIHATAGLMMLYGTMRDLPERDDRWKANPERSGQEVEHGMVSALPTHHG